MSASQYAVVVDNAYKRYDKNAIVLNGLSMNVKQGTVYGLLGSSGCGKTTLLNCILGTKSLDYGTIFVSTVKRSGIGYMPQNISLCLDFTVGEVLIYYGALYDISMDKVYQDGANLHKFLQLPPMNQQIKFCSGGQQRRLSLAVALLNDPKILLLDEPTAGVDPVLSNEITQYLFNLVEKQGKTLIITTHYIEEARRSHEIGFMRGGVLVAEDSPDVLLERYNSETLEGVFLKISETQNIQEDKPYPTGMQTNKRTFGDNNQFFNARRFKAQVFKSYMRIKGNLLESALMMLMPSFIIILVFFLCLENSGEISLKPYYFSVVNEETDCGENFQIELGYRCPSLKMLSCRYVEIVNEFVSTRRSGSVADGLDDVKRGVSNGVIFFEKNFTEFVWKKITQRVSASDETMEKSQVQIWLDQSQYPFARQVEKKLIDGALKMMKEFGNACGYNKKSLDIPVNFGKAIYEAEILVHRLLWGLYFCSIFYTFLVYSSSSLITERNSGCFERDRTAGLTMLDLILSKAFVQLNLMTVQSAISLTVLFAICNFQREGNIGMVMFTCYMSQIVGMSIGFFLGIFFRRESDVTYIMIGILLTLQQSSGSIWPTQGHHWTTRYLVEALPSDVLINVFVNIIVKGWGLNVLWIDFFYILLIIGLITLVTFSAVKTGMASLQ